jgi:general secretion pathway protein G
LKVGIASDLFAADSPPESVLVSRDRGFTLIELLVVVAIIGILAAIAIPNMLNSIDRGKQKRTMADMRTIATVLEEYAIDNNHYPLQATQGSIATTVAPSLYPDYVPRIPDVDGWNRDIQYGTTADAGDYTIRSLGKDGVKNGSGGMTGDFNCDIIMQVGQFTAWPSGLQT